MISLSKELENLINELPISKILDSNEDNLRSPYLASSKDEEGDSSVNSLGVIPNGKLVKKKNKDVSPIIKGECNMTKSRAAMLLEKQYMLLDEATKFVFNPIVPIGGYLADIVASIESELGKDALKKYDSSMLIVDGDAGKVKDILAKYKIEYTVETAEAIIDGQDVVKTPDQVSVSQADPNMVSPQDPEVQNPAEAPTIASLVMDCLKGGGFDVQPVDGGFSVSKDGAAVILKIG